MLLVLLIISSLAVAFLGPETSTMLTIAKPVVVPVITVMIAVIALCGLATVVVYLLTEIVDQFRK